MEYLYSPFPLLAVMSKIRTSRTIRDGIMDCRCLNSNGKNAKLTVVRVARWAWRTVCQGLVDHPREGRGPSARSTRAAHHTVCFEDNFGLSAVDSWTVHPEVTFLEKLCQKPQILNKLQRPTDRPPQGLGLSALQQKTYFSLDFQRNLFIKWNCHSSKCNACRF
jgi:hypothetical protein